MTNLKPFPPDTRDREVPVLESSVQVAVTGVTVAWLCCFFWWGPGGSRGRSSIIMIPRPYKGRGAGVGASLGSHEAKGGTFAGLCQLLSG